MEISSAVNSTSEISMDEFLSECQEDKLPIPPSSTGKEGLSILWFRHGIRLHDNPSLHEAIKATDSQLLPIFIFDGESAGTSLCGYNRMAYLLECLQDLDNRFKKFGTKLHLFKGKPIDIFEHIRHHYGSISKICFEQDCEPIWKTRDLAVKGWCHDQQIECVESIGHTLWNPQEVIQMNGGKPPVTFSMFNHVVSAIGLPPKPLQDIDLSNVIFANLNSIPEGLLMNFFPTCEDLDVHRIPGRTYQRVYHGGETFALEHLEERLAHEYKAFTKHSLLPNRRNPELLCPPKSLSPDLRFGALSIRKFYWGIMAAFRKSQEGTTKPHNPQIVTQLLWREFFYTMSVNNQFYGEMDRNEICINIPWYPSNQNDHLEKFCNGQTGYPLIDAGIRQLLQEGWIHHIIRNAMASFLTRGDLWISWEKGLTFFLENLLDADWSVCAGNWMWISSSAFEDVLNCTSSINPGTYGRRTDPFGEYVQKYLPVLADMPVEYIYEPWTAPLSVQQKAKCVIGKDYPERIVIHEVVSVRNANEMNRIKTELMETLQGVPNHIKPSNATEARTFLGLTQDSTTQ